MAIGKAASVGHHQAEETIIILQPSISAKVVGNGITAI
jgi:hypothetical protein